MHIHKSFNSKIYDILHVLSYGMLNCSVPIHGDSSLLPFFLVPPNIGWFPQFYIECVQKFLVLF